MGNFHFANRAPRSVLSRDQSFRQGEAVRLAAMVLPDKDAVLHFLNSVDPDLGVRPIDLAIESLAGLKQVEIAVARAGARHPG